MNHNIELDPINALKKAQKAISKNSYIQRDPYKNYGDMQLHYKNFLEEHFKEVGIKQYGVSANRSYESPSNGVRYNVVYSFIDTNGKLQMREISIFYEVDKIVV